MADSDFQPVARLSELRDGEPHGIEIAGRLAVLVRCGEQVYALGGHCPHTGMRLQDGVVAEGRLICFYHGANFDLATGRNIPERLRGGRFDTRDVPRYAVCVEGNTVYVATAPDNPEALP
ncbi:MAG TPA: Rieske 2Fe-2S domain-containing protein [Chloroflexota bacterium]|nr:Rieske 2Fe-2S domain-containing protein [Chloroflexota bacterium]